MWQTLLPSDWSLMAGSRFLLSRKRDSAHPASRGELLVLLHAPNMASATRHAGVRLSRSVALAFGLFFVFCLTSACQTSCEPGNQAPIPYVDGKTHTSGSDRIYETTPYDSEWLDFQSNRRFSFQHNLNTTDYRIEAWTAFSSHPVASSSDASSSSGDVAPVTGDVFVVDQRAANTLLVRNDSCSQQYLYVKLTASAALSDAGL